MSDELSALLQASQISSVLPVNNAHFLNMGRAKNT